MSELVLEEQLELRQPALVMAFAGWPDAAEASSRAVTLLRTKLGATRVGEIAPEGFYDLTVIRPRIAVRSGVFRSFEYPSSAIYAWHNTRRGGRDVLLLQASEPSLRWPLYVESVLDLVERCGVSAVYSMGSLFDGVPHTRPARISMAVAQPELRRRMLRLHLTPVDYEGPGSIHTAVLDACRQRQVPAASFWGHVPAYAQVNWSPRTSLALLEVLLSAMDLSLDLTDLRDQAAQLDALLDRLVESDDDLKQQIREYERRHEDDPGDEEPTLPSAEAVLNEVEWLLRKGPEEDAPDQ
jgi:proteasome assembly chaperone (PAC2) family protein